MSFVVERKAVLGFSLLEVLIALAILGISLTVLLQSQAASLDNAGRSRDLTQATLLARGKMIDIEKHLFHAGFQMGTEEDSGDFSEEGHKDILWKYRISEIELDLTALASVCGEVAGKSDTKKKDKDKDEDNPANECESMIGSLGSMLGSFTDEIARSLRVVDLQVTWPVGRYEQSMQIRAMLSRDDFNTQQEGTLQRDMNILNQSGAGAPGTPAVPGQAPGGALR